jgi:hypothetical protein
MFVTFATPTSRHTHVIKLHVEIEEKDRVRNIFSKVFDKFLLFICLMNDQYTLAIYNLIL